METGATARFRPPAILFLLKNVVTSRPKVATRIGHGMKKNRISHSHSIMFVGFSFFPTMVIREVRRWYGCLTSHNPTLQFFGSQVWKHSNPCPVVILGPIVRSGSWVWYFQVNTEYNWLEITWNSCTINDSIARHSLEALEVASISGPKHHENNMIVLQPAHPVSRTCFS